MVIVVFGAGCARARFALDEVPIVGGDAAMRDAIRAELDAFLAAVGPGRVALSEVVVEARDADADADALGSFDRAADRVWVEATLDPSSAPTVVRHELCHALDFAEDLATDPTGPVAALERGIEDAAYPAFDRSYGARAETSEAFALFCGLGPAEAAVIRTPCPTDPPLAAPVGAWLSDRVWRKFTPPPAGPPLGPPTASWPVPVDGCATFGLGGTTDPEVITVLTCDAAGASTNAQAELYTGAPWLGPPASGVPDAQPAPPSIERLDGYTPEPIGWPAGPGASRLSYSLVHLGDAAPRIAYSDGGPWGVVPGLCADLDAYDLFVADDQLWYGWRDGGSMAWAPLGP